MRTKLKKSGRIGLEVLLTALALGVAGDSLLRSVPWGLNVPLMAFLGITAVAILKLRAEGAYPATRTLALLGASMFFASWFAIRDSEPLLFLNFLAIVLIGAMVFLPSMRLKAGRSGVVHYALSAAAMAASAALMPFILLTKDVRWNGVGAAGRSRKAVLVLRGALIAAPLVLVFGALFAAADAGFEGLVQNAFDVVPEELLLHAIFTAVFAWPAAGYLRSVTIGVPPFDASVYDHAERAGSEFPAEGVASVTEPGGAEDQDSAEFGSRHIPSITAEGVEEAADPAEREPPASDTEKAKAKRKWSWQDLNNSFLPEFLTVGPVEVGVVLGALNLLFLTFVIIQLPYLFGGMDLVQARPGLKLAEYARRGFGELFVASMLVLPVLLALHWLIRRESGGAVRLFRYLAITQIALLFVIMLSAFQRLLLLTGDLGYGMTEGRFYPMAFLIWFAVVFVIFGSTVLRGNRDRFAGYAAVSALLMVAALNFANPDDYIVRTNLALAKEGRDFDTVYNSRLSADAFPALRDSYASMEQSRKNEVLSGLARYRCFNPAIRDLRTWNLSRSRFEGSEFYRDHLLQKDCSEVSRSVHD